MDRETLSNYGWIAIATLVLVVLLALATPFGTYISNGIISVSRSYNTVAEKKMSEENLNKTQTKFESVIKTNKTTEDTTRASGTLIPTGAKYTIKASNIMLNTILEGNGVNVFPDTPATGDTYEEGDYKYTYNKGVDGTNNDYGTEWSVLVLDKTKSSYGKILSQIANKPVTNMKGTFTSGKSLTTAPMIPDSVTDITDAFYKCTLLITAPTIPNSVTNMSGTFMVCTSLTTAPTIPDSVTSMNSTFAGCTSLTVAPTIPDSVTNIFTTFMDCTSLTGTITINANPTVYDYCFGNTTKPITLTGSSTKLTEIAATANKNNVTVK